MRQRQWWRERIVAPTPVSHSKGCLPIHRMVNRSCTSQKLTGGTEHLEMTVLTLWKNSYWIVSCFWWDFLVWYWINESCAMFNLCSCDWQSCPSRVYIKAFFLLEATAPCRQNVRRWFVHVVIPAWNIFIHSHFPREQETLLILSVCVLWMWAWRCGWGYTPCEMVVMDERYQKIQCFQK